MLLPSPGDDQMSQCWCPIVSGKIVPVDPTIVGGVVTKAIETGPNAFAVAFLPKDPGRVKERRHGWIKLRGDFVIDTKDRAIDAEFVRAQFPTGDRPAGSAFGVQGGLFESWFTLG